MRRNAFIDLYNVHSKSVITEAVRKRWLNISKQPILLRQTISRYRTYTVFEEFFPGDKLEREESFCPLITEHPNGMTIITSRCVCRNGFMGISSAHDCICWSGWKSWNVLVAHARHEKADDVFLKVVGSCSVLAEEHDQDIKKYTEYSNIRVCVPTSERDCTEV